MSKPNLKDDKLSSILKEFAALDANKIAEINENPDGLIAGLQTIDANSAKHVIAWKLFTKSANGNLNATKLFLEQIGEDEGKKLKLATDEEVTSLKIEDLRKMSLSKLSSLEKQISQKKNQKWA
jgi:hypothetical protein